MPPTGGIAGGRTFALLTAILLLGFALRVTYLTVDRFHADEALYAGWALAIRDHDPLLVGVPVDKPPLYLYALAASAVAFGPSEVAFRLPSLGASILGIALVYLLGARLYGRTTGLWAATFVALSPFDVLFARTAFTDPMLVLWGLAALYAVARHHWFWAGVGLGLAFATKQHALFWIPLVAAVGRVQLQRGTDLARRFALALLGFALPFALVVAWDSARWAVRPGFWQQSAMSYGGLSWAAPGEWGERIAEWLRWARYLVPSPVLGAVLLAGCAALLLHGWRYHPHERRTRLDTVLIAYVACYLLLHAVLRFSVWDRYLLPLTALVSMLLARVSVQTTSWLSNIHPGKGQGGVLPGSLGVAFAAVVCVAALLPASKAARNGYPIGGEHWAYQGLDQVTAYLVRNAPPSAVLYHHWLRWHYEYYLYGSGIELRWWQSGEHLRREAMRTPERAQYIVLPDWRTLEPHAEGVRFQPVHETRRADGSVSLRLYRIELDPLLVRDRLPQAANTGTMDRVPRDRSNLEGRAGSADQVSSATAREERNE